jgi:hypothetical protein
MGIVIALRGTVYPGEGSGEGPHGGEEGQVDFGYALTKVFLRRGAIGFGHPKGASGARIGMFPMCELNR